MEKITFTEDQIRLIVKYYTEDMMGLRPIAERFGTSYMTIRRILIEAGVSPSRSGRRWAKHERVCRFCWQKKPVSEFYKKDYVCKACASKHKSQYRLYVGKYGISPSEARALAIGQDYRCAICGKSEEENGRNLAIDHDHKTGKIRGLLCTTCNIGLACLEIDPDWAEKALAYLRKFAYGLEPEF